MKDNNAKAPKVRSGDNINPVLGSIIKISAIVVIAALIVLITLVVVKLVQNKNEAKPLFGEDRIVLSKAEYLDLTDPETGIDDIKSLEVKAIMEKYDEDVTIYFYFYYSNLRKETTKDKKEEIERLKVISKDAPIFIVDLYEPETEENKGSTITDILRKNEKLSETDIQINTILDATEIVKKKTVKKYLTFVLSLEFANKNEKDPYTDFRGLDANGNSAVLELLNNTLK